MSNLPEDLAVLFLKVGDEISQNDYAAIPITIEGEDVPLQVPRRWPPVSCWEARDNYRIAFC